MLFRSQHMILDEFLLHFRDRIFDKQDVEYLENDIGMSFLKDSAYYTDYFLKRGSDIKYKYINTDLRKGITRGMITDENSKKTKVALFNSCHSMQGLEVPDNGRLIVIVNSKFDAGLFYTAASRCKRLDQLIIINEYYNRDAEGFNEMQKSKLENNEQIQEILYNFECQ